MDHAEARPDTGKSLPDAGESLLDAGESLLDKDEDRAWQAFFETQVRFWRKLAQLLQQDTGLSEPDFAILSALHQAPGGQLRPFELSGVTQFEKSRLHHQLTRMVGRGLITRERCPDDARAAIIALTDHGRSAITAALPRRTAHIRDWLIEPLDAGQLAALTEISDAILDKLRTDDTTEQDEDPDQDRAPERCQDPDQDDSAAGSCSAD
ncbi:MarR family winged helix-turn-helix transcriptional regulator [Actinacidiphila paucisporea]|uniref:Transcriptional regulator, MarR family n=1 Tax=Actinacidiphila paucisporea TaxID=310782 RepID=A0A1M7QEJ9_9ACTN|nr:MarR family winged helix-turn-helix transcriptional regulator [Actinacidiphila paucisporea]SHN29334.1 transcriptional regulator, MarR family [Actinacidiphila paucisporea]